LAQRYLDAIQGWQNPDRKKAISENVKDNDGVVDGAVGPALRRKEYVWVRKLALKYDSEKSE
jgi:hypothetical protein